MLRRRGVPMNSRSVRRFDHDRLWEAHRRQKVPFNYIHLLQNLYDNQTATVQALHNPTRREAGRPTQLPTFQRPS